MSIHNILDTASCKIKNTHNNLHRWKSWEPNTPFAPVFDCPIWVEDLNTYFVEELIKDIQKNNLGSYRDTWKKYNIFEWKTEATRSIKDSITRVYYDYTNVLGLPKERVNDIWIRGWAVVLQPGDPVPRHCHSYHENTFLSGNIMLTDNQTTTDSSSKRLLWSLEM